MDPAQYHWASSIASAQAGQSNGWEKLQSKDGVEVLARVPQSGRDDGAEGLNRNVNGDMEVNRRAMFVVRSVMVVKMAPKAVFRYLWRFRHRSAWDSNFVSGNKVSETKSEQVLKMRTRTFNDTIVDSQRDVTVRRVCTRSADNYFVIGEENEATVNDDDPYEYRTTSGHWIQPTMPADNAVVITGTSFVLSEVGAGLLGQSAAETSTAVLQWFTRSYDQVRLMLDIESMPSSSTGDDGGDNGSPVRHGARRSGSTSKIYLWETSAEERQRLVAEAKSAGDASGGVVGGGASRFCWKRGRLLGVGGMGEVYLSLNLSDGELMAVKQVCLKGRDDPDELLKSLENEVNTLATLRHPSVVEYIGVERDGDHVNIFLEYISGGSLEHKIAAEGGEGFSESAVRSYARQVLQGLQFLHENGITHRDVKAANMLVTEDGIIKLADFGSFKKHPVQGKGDQNDGGPDGSGDHGEVDMSSMTGTPRMMAPEVIRRTGGGVKADIWSFGCSIIEMSTGHAPWSNFANELAAMYHIATVEGPPVLPDTLSSELTSFITACMQRDPRMRPTAAELAYHTFLTGEPDTSLDALATQGKHSGFHVSVVGSGSEGHATSSPNTAVGAPTRVPADACIPMRSPKLPTGRPSWSHTTGSNSSGVGGGGGVGGGTGGSGCSGGSGGSGVDHVTSFPPLVPTSGVAPMRERPKWPPAMERRGSGGGLVSSVSGGSPTRLGTLSPSQSPSHGGGYFGSSPTSGGGGGGGSAGSGGRISPVSQQGGPQRSPVPSRPRPRLGHGSSPNEHDLLQMGSNPILHDYGIQNVGATGGVKLPTTVPMHPETGFGGRRGAASLGLSVDTMSTSPPLRPSLPKGPAVAPNLTLTSPADRGVATR